MKTIMIILLVVLVLSVSFIFLTSNIEETISNYKLRKEIHRLEQQTLLNYSEGGLGYSILLNESLKTSDGVES